MLASTGAIAQDTAKIGLVLPLTGGLARRRPARFRPGAKLYTDKNGTTVAGKKIELIIKDDAGVPDNSKRLAQELIVNDKVARRRLGAHAERAGDRRRSRPRPRPPTW